MNCPKCSTAMKVLFVGWYCPNDCDKPATGSTERSTGTQELWWTIAGLTWRNTGGRPEWACATEREITYIRDSLWPNHAIRKVVKPKVLGRRVEYEGSVVCFYGDFEYV